MSKIQESEIHKLHPTQITVGMIEVDDIKKHLSSLKPNEQKEFMAQQPIPTIIGPEGKLYITDHHHLGRAALEAGVTNGFFEVEADLSNLSGNNFWEEMAKNKWVHPQDEYGVRHRYESLPNHIEKLIDDIYRSLAGYVRNAGGYERTPTAFAEFVWADFFRRNIPVEDIMSDFHANIQTGIDLSLNGIAKGLPGYKGK